MGTGTGMGTGTRLASSRGDQLPLSLGKGSSWPGMSQQVPMPPKVCSLLSRLPVRPRGEASCLQNSPAAGAQGCWVYSGRGHHAWGHLLAPPPHLPAPPPHLASAKHDALGRCHSTMPFQPGSLHWSQQTALPWLGMETMAFKQMFPGDGESCWHPLLRGPLSTQQGLPA